jgi:hypothetical protein
MRWLLALCLTAAGCSKSSEQTEPNPPPTKTVETAPTKSARESKSSPPAATEPPAKKPAKKVVKTFRGHLKEGRKLIKADKWTEAVVHFEKALEHLPEDPRALSELGWAAYKAGDLAKSSLASRKAVKHAKSPKLVAASLYNLGRALEDTGKKKEAVKAYAESIEHRPNMTVKKRLLGLAPDHLSKTDTPTPLDLKSLDALCGDGDKLEGESEDCAIESAHGNFVLWYETITDDRDRGDVSYWLGRKVGTKYGLFENVWNGYVHHKLIAKLELKKVDTQQIANRTVHVFTLERTTGDDEVMTTVETVKETVKVLCIEDNNTFSCPVSVTSEATWTATIGGEDQDDPDILQWFKDDYGAAPPVTWSYALDVRLDQSGQVTLKGTRGVKYEHSYNLW